MAKLKESEHVTPGDGNVFADLGFDPAEAAELHDKATQIIAKKLAIKQQLMTEISGWIETNHLKQADAASILGVTRPRVSDVVQKRVNNFTVDALIDMLVRAGKQVTVSV